METSWFYGNVRGITITNRLLAAGNFPICSAKSDQSDLEYALLNLFTGEEEG